MTITPEQCRAARALLAWSQLHLSEASRVAERTIQSFEKGTRTALPANLSVLQTTLEKAGVEFIAENGGGPGVRLKKRKARKA